MNIEVNKIYCGECLDIMRDMPDDSVDLVFCSPPYEDARDYGVGFKLKGQEWVDWSVERFMECVRVSKGLVAWVVEGRTRQFKYSATPILFMADLHRAGIKLRKPPIYKRNGIPGSGGPEWLANKYEFIVCASKGRLPWSDNTACGHTPKYKAGGEISHRTQSGERVNKKYRRNRRPNGEREQRAYNPPKLSNPGNIIDCGTCGGANMGSKLAHENEAPFPESLAEFFVKSFCPPGGIVMDIFSGSGTTAAVADNNGRRYIAVDVRQSQVDLSGKRVKEMKKGQGSLFTTPQ